MTSHAIRHRSGLRLVVWRQSTWVLFLFLPCVMAISEFKMEDLCGSDVSMILEDVHQLRVSLDDFGAPATYVTSRQCDVTLEGWYTWPKLMVYFEELNLNCTDGHVSLYDGKEDNAIVAGLPRKICGHVAPTGVFVATNGTLSVAYVANTPAVNLGVVSLIVTAFSTDADHVCPSSAFKCTNGRCKEAGTRCNGFNSCGDHSGCRTDMTSVALAGIVLGSLAGVAVLLTIVILVACQIKKHKQETTNSRASRYVTDSSGDKPTNRNQNTPYSFAAAIFQDQRQKSKGIVSGQSPAYPPNWTPSINLDDNTWAADENDVQHDATCSNINDVDIDVCERSCVVSNDAASVAEGTDNPASDVTEHVDNDEDVTGNRQSAECQTDEEHENRCDQQSDEMR